MAPSYRFYTVDVEALLDRVAFDGLIADKTFDSKVVIEDPDERGAKIVSTNGVA